MTLLGIPGDATYSNYAEAQRAFWRQTVLPLVNRTAKALGHWLAGAFDDAATARNGYAASGAPGAVASSASVQLELRPDLDQVEGLSSEREALWARLNAATFLTDDEKRAAAGYGAKAESDAGGEAIRGSEARAASATAKFNPNHDELGRFTFGDGGGGGDAISGGDGTDAPTGDPGNDRVQVAQAEPSQGYRVDLLEEDARGGHTKEYHVGKTPEILKSHVRQKSAEFIAQGVKANRIRAGSYPSVEAATKLTNATLAQNRGRVDKVAKGEVLRDFVTAGFPSATGTEAYARNVREEPSVRDTYGVGVRIVHDPSSKNGFTVITSYPRNDD